MFITLDSEKSICYIKNTTITYYESQITSSVDAHALHNYFDLPWQHLHKVTSIQYQLLIANELFANIEKSNIDFKV